MSKPRLWALIFTLPALCVLLGLGYWQLQRLDWKRELIAMRQAGLTAPPIALPAEFDAALEFRRVQLTGAYLSAAPLFLYPRSRKNVAGVHVLTPFKLQDGRILIIDRGFVATDGRGPDVDWQDPLKAGDGSVLGVMRTELTRHFWAEDGIDRDGLINWYDIPTMRRYFKLDLLPVVVEAIDSPHPNVPPWPGQSRVNLPNNHLQYAITWFGLAAALAVIFMIFWRREGRGPEPGQ